jgi:hypothetical protein
MTHGQCCPWVFLGEQNETLLHTVDCCCFLTSPTVAFAYDDLSGGWAVPSLDTSISIANDVMNQTIIREFVAKEVRAKAVVRSNKTNVRDENLQEKSNINLSENSEYLRFNSSIIRRKQNFAQFIAKTKPNNPEGAQQMERIFSSSDVIAAIAKGISSFGLRVDNVADAYTVYWTNAWLGSRGRSDTLTQQQISSVRTQAARALLSIPAFVSASDTQKQQMAEAMLVQAALIEAYIGNAKSDPALMTKVKAAIVQGAKGMGLDLYKMTLTPDGFIPAKRGSAVDDSDIPSLPEDTPSEAELASNTGDETAPNYALIAAAGGAGLGGMFLLGKAMGRKS